MKCLAEGSDRIVAFVGAGGSSLPPSYLPTWKSFNDLLLESLCARLGEYSGNRQPVAEMLELFRSRRDATAFFPADFQAQLIEEEIGADYFRVWQSLDTDVYGPVHAGLAALAARRRLAAIITLNFDRLFETTLTAGGQSFDVSYEAAGFERLLAAFEEAGEDGAAPLPVIKLHGSIQDPASLVDTLRQRMVGRPTVVDAALTVLLREYRWLFLGFSGSDWNYDPHYLGILDAAPEAKGFVFVARDPDNIEKGVREVVNAYGPDKASVVGGDLNVWITQAFQLPPPKLPASSQTKDDVQRRVRDGIEQWVEGLGPMSVVNIVCSMLKTSGLEVESYWLLRKTWKSYRAPLDTTGPSYDRYNYNQGMSLLEAGQICNPVALTDDMSNLPQWKEYADQNAYEFFARSYRSGKLGAAGAALACVMGYRGDVGKAIGLLSEVTAEVIARARNSPLDLCDVALASVVVYDIVQTFRPPAAQLRQCLELAKAVGDEPRRALLCAHLGRLLTYSSDFGEADRFLKEADAIAHRLDLAPALVATRAARGLWLTDSRTSHQEAVRLLRELAGELRSADLVPWVRTYDVLSPDRPPVEIKPVNPRRCRVLLDLNRAAMMAGDADLINQTLDELDELTAANKFTGYYPHYCIAYAQCLLTRGDGDQRKLATDLLARARLVGNDSQNPWAGQMAEFIAKEAGIPLPPTSPPA